MHAACHLGEQQQRGEQQQQQGEQQGEQQQQTPGHGGSSKPVVVLVGATLGPELVEHAVGRGWVRDPVTVRVGVPMRIPSGLRHRVIVVPREEDKTAALCRQLRADLRG